MTTNQIKNKLNVKFDDFLNSIEDDNIKTLIKDNAIITGGAIASMLLNEKVNDYDIYFKSKEAALTICQYYIKSFLKLAKAKLITEKKDNIINHILNLRCTINENKGINIYIPSSGILTLDNFEKYLYFENVENNGIQIDNFLVNDIATDKAKYQPAAITKNAISLNNDVQLIFRFVDDVENIHKNFDFVHTTNYWDAKENQLVYHKIALESILTKRLMYIGSLYPLATLFRVRKFIERGFTIHAGDLLKIGFQINDLDLKDYEVLTDQLTGVDVAYLNELLEILKAEKEKDKDFEITTIYISKIIDKIFN